MDIFEKQRLSDIASVEQVSLFLGMMQASTQRDISLARQVLMRTARRPRVWWKRWSRFLTAEMSCKIYQPSLSLGFLLNLDTRRNMKKVRIIALYIQYRDGVPDEDRRRLYQHARLSLAEQDAVNSLLLMGARISRVSGDWKSRPYIFVYMSLP